MVLLLESGFLVELLVETILFDGAISRSRVSHGAIGDKSFCGDIGIIRGFCWLY